jgi:hypothetical protein
MFKRYTSIAPVQVKTVMVKKRKLKLKPNLPFYMLGIHTNSVLYTDPKHFEEFSGLILNVVASILLFIFFVINLEFGLFAITKITRIMITLYTYNNDVKLFLKLHKKNKKIFGRGE